MHALNKHPRPFADLKNRRLLVGNLLFTHAVIVGSERLIEEALKEPMTDKLREYYTKHLEEEHEHAGWLHRDLSTAGFTPSLDWDAAKLVGTQYYLIKHSSPFALLGYMAALECKPMPLKLVSTLEKTHGKNLLRTLRYHAEHDVQHSSDLIDFIESVPEPTFSLVVSNIEQSSLMLNKAFNRIIREAA